MPTPGPVTADLPDGWGMAVPGPAAADLSDGWGMAMPGPVTADLPDAWGFAYLDNPSPPPNSVMDPARQAGSFQIACPGSQATVTQNGVGSYSTRFPCIGRPRGIARMTAVDAAGRFCEVGGWSMSGPDEVVEVYCFDAAAGRDQLGMRVDSWFVLSYHHKTTVYGGAGPPAQPAYVLAPGPAPPDTDVNSAGGVNPVAAHRSTAG